MSTYGFNHQQGEPNISAKSVGPFYFHGNDISNSTMGHPHGSGNLHAQGDVQGSAQMRAYHQGPPDVSQHPQQDVLHQDVPYAPSPLEQYMKRFPSQLKFKLSSLSSRVETQFDVTFTLSNAQTGVERVRIPRHLISNMRYLAKEEEAANLQTLQLRTFLVSADAMKSPEIKLETLKEAATNLQHSAREVKICSACIGREILRAGRKKNNKIEAPWDGHEDKRTVILSGEEYSTWERRQVENGRIDLQLKMPVRITCYCRHHDSKQGFCIIFTLVDHKGRWVAQGMTPPIYITDNHKDALVKGEKLEKRTTGSGRVRKRSPPAEAGPKERPARRERKVQRRREEALCTRELQDMPPMGANNPPPNPSAALGPVCLPTNDVDLSAGMGQTFPFDEPGFPPNNTLLLGGSTCIPNIPQHPFLEEMLAVQQQPNYAYASANALPQGERAQNMALYNGLSTSDFVGMAAYANRAIGNRISSMNPAQPARANSLMDAPGTNSYPNMAADAAYYNTNIGVDLTAFANTGPYHGNVGMGSSDVAPHAGPWNHGGMPPNAPNASALNDGATGQSNMVPHAVAWNYGVMIPNAFNAGLVNNGDMPPNAPNASALNDGAMGQLNIAPDLAPWNYGVMIPNAPNASALDDGAMGQLNIAPDLAPWNYGVMIPNALKAGSVNNGGMLPNTLHASVLNNGAMVQSSVVVDPNPWGNGDMNALNFPNMPQVAEGDFVNAAGIALPNAANMGSSSPPEVGPAGTVGTYTQNMANPNLWNTVDPGTAGIVDLFHAKLWETTDGTIFDEEKQFDAEQETISTGINNFVFTGCFSVGDGADF